MADYMAQRIIDRAYEYTYVVTRRPDLKDGINRYLTDKSRQDLIIA